MSDVAVIDDLQHQRFVLRSDGGPEAELIYRLEPGRLILVHTEVPDALGGHGIGGQLVEAALDRARAGALTVAPWCPFARGWMRRHPERLEGITVDWSSPPES